jgi:hypothetical protein
MTLGLLALALIGSLQATPPPCRVAAVEFTAVNKAANLTAESTSTCTFDRKALTFTCTTQHKDSLGTKTIAVSVTTYESVADIVDEIAVIPPRLRALRVDSTTESVRVSAANEPRERSGASGLPRASVKGGPADEVPRKGPTRTDVVYSYDKEHRLMTELATTQGSKSVATTTYTSWDAQGRPTAGKISVSGSRGGTLRLSYDDAQRVQTITSEAAGQRVTCEMGFDANGNSISHSCRGSGGLMSSTNITIGKTENICR